MSCILSSPHLPGPLVQQSHGRMVQQMGGSWAGIQCPLWKLLEKLYADLRSGWGERRSAAPLLDSQCFFLHLSALWKDLIRLCFHYLLYLAVTQRKRNKRKRKLLVDVVKELSCNAIYNQLNNSTDTLTTLDLAPPTKKTMLWKQWGGVDKLLTQATQPVFHTELQKVTAGSMCRSRSVAQLGLTGFSLAGGSMGTDGYFHTLC